MDWIVEQGRVFSKDDHGELIAEATFYEKSNGDFYIDHTYVVPRLRSRGIADEMKKALATVIRERGGKVTASCSYANAWLKRHKGEYTDIISKDLMNEAIACHLKQ